MAGEFEYPKEDGDVSYGNDANARFGVGEGVDGDFDETGSGTTNLVQGTVYQYSSFNLGSAHTISASSNSNKPIIILVQGNVTIDGTIDLSGLGATSNYASGADVDETPWGTIGTTPGPATGVGGAGGYGGLSFFGYAYNQRSFIMNGTSGGDGRTRGGGGGGGASSNEDGNNGGSVSEGADGTPGTGGDGGCSLYIFCGGTLTFGSSSSIDCSGVNGGAASSGTAGGGGGGGGGDIIIIHKGAKTDNGLSTDVTGGSGGAASGAGAAGGAGGTGNLRIYSWDEVLW